MLIVIDIMWLNATQLNAKTALQRCREIILRYSVTRVRLHFAFLSTPFLPSYLSAASIKYELPKENALL